MNAINSALKILLLLACLPASSLRADETVAPAPGASPASTAAPETVATAGTASLTAQPATKTQPAPYAAELRRNTQEVFKGPDFHQEESSTGLALRPWLKKWLDSWDFTPKSKEEKKKAPEFPLLAQLLKLAVILVLAAAVIWLLWQGYRWLSPRLGRKAVQDALQKPLSATESLTLEKSSLPDGISDAARRAWQAGQQAEALSLLYRGAVRTLTSRQQLELPVSATEGECLRLARRHATPSTVSAFTPIVQAWVALAYAGHPPSDFETLLSLYRQHFETAGNGGTS